MKSKVVEIVKEVKMPSEMDVAPKAISGLDWIGISGQGYAKSTFGANDNNEDVNVNLPVRCGLIPLCTAPQIFPLKLCPKVLFKARNIMSYNMI